MEDGSDPSCAEHKYKSDYSWRRDLTQVFRDAVFAGAVSEVGFSAPHFGGALFCGRHDLYFAAS